MNNEKPVTLSQISREIREMRNEIKYVRAEIKDVRAEVQDVRAGLRQEIRQAISDNNAILIPLIDQKIKANNEYIFSEFNDQTERILSLFRGVIRVKRDGTFSVSF